MSAELFDNHQWDFAQNRYERADDFLRDILIEELQEKIKDHQRPFARIALIGKDAPSWAAEFPLKIEAIEISDALNFSTKDYDLILHLGALHRMNDPVGQLIQSRLVLAPDGVLMVAFLGGETLSELRHAFHHAEAEIYNGTSPHIAPMIDIKDAGNLVARAGLALPIADNIRREVRYSALPNLLHDLRKLGLGNPLTARRKSFTKRALFDALNRIYTENFTCEPDRIYASFELIFLTGYAPSADQPQPLRPGSITKSFGENDETNL